MRIELSIEQSHYWAELDRCYDLTIPLDFDSSQPNHFGADAASAKAFEVPGFSGRTVSGASCNVDQITFVPHCNGTHTETLGHLLHETVTAADIDLPALIPAALITITPQSHHETQDSYDPAFDPEDLVVSRDQLHHALSAMGWESYEALIVRTLPNPEPKTAWQYNSDRQAAFFTIEAAQFIRDLDVQHLIVDLPSVDRSQDGGKLNIHRIFWDIDPGSHELGSKDTSQRTVTELAYIPNEADDGLYLLSLGLPRFRSDAAPSRIRISPLVAMG